MKTSFMEKTKILNVNLFIYVVFGHTTWHVGLSSLTKDSMKILALWMSDYMQQFLMQR